MKKSTLFTCLIIVTQVFIYSQTCTPPPPNMISWWTGDVDASDFLNSNDGVLLNGTSTETGMVDQALSFDGIDDKVEIADTSDLDFATGEFSIDFWVKPNNCSVPSSDAIPFITKESESQFDAYVIGIVTGEEFIFAGSSDALAFQTVVRGGTCIPDEWHFITITQSANIAKLYVNGILVSTDNSAVIPINTSLPLMFGYRKDVSSNSGLQTRYFDGQLDEIEFFDRALSETEILAIYDAGTDGKCKIIEDNGDDDDDDIEDNDCLNFICGHNNNKVLICHNGHEICISPDAAEAHLEHGDYCGPCNSDEDIEDDETLIYPNPTVNTFNLVMDKEIIEKYKKLQIKISDIYGKTALVKNITSAQCEINISELNKGIYIYYIISKKVILKTGRISKE